MDDDRARRLKDRSLAFFGAITAGQSHEVTNVLNVINELAGLQKDILVRAGDGHPPDLEKLRHIAERVQAQVIRGETIARNINRFAHSADVPHAVFDLGEAVDRILFLAERSARLKKAALVGALPEANLALEGNPFSLQQAIFICIQVALDSATVKRSVVVSYSILAGGVEFVVRSDDPMTDLPDLPERLARLGESIEDLRGRLTVRPDVGDPCRIAFIIPHEQHEEDIHGRGQGTPDR